MNKIIAIVILLMMLGCSDSDRIVVPTSDAVMETPEIPAPQLPPLPTDEPETLAETLTGDALKWYNWMPQTHKDDIDFYAEAFGYEAASVWINEALPEGGAYGIPPPLTAPLPSFNDALTADEQKKLQSLDQRILDVFTSTWSFGIDVKAADTSDPTAYTEGRISARVVELRELLVVIPSEIPPAQELLHADELAIYESLHPDLQELFLVEVATAYAQGLTVGRGVFPALDETEVKDLFSQYIPPLVTQGKSCSDHTQPCLKSN